jgi:hypothetical protein
MFNLHQLHTASGMIIVLAFCVKVCLHVYLDQAMGKAKTWQSILFFPLPFMNLYKAEVSNEYRLTKIVCNAMLYLTITALILNLIFGLNLYP